MRTLTLLSVLLLLAPAVLADTMTADFEAGVNLGNWTFNHWDEGINEAGGNPDGWYYGLEIWTFAPILTCGNLDETFAGNYAARGVTRISGDFKTDYCQNDPGANSFNFAVLLRNDMGTPNDPEDDLYVYPNPDSDLIPQIGAGWTHYDWDIPSDFEGGPGELPAGWLGGSYMSGGDIFPSDRTFQEVITNVTTVEFWWLHPAMFAIIVPWDAGADNITIEYESSVATQETSWTDVKALFR